MLTRPKLQIPNPLPSPRIQPPIAYRHRDTRPDQRTLDMRRHIIRPLTAMLIQIPLPVLRRDAIEGVRHVSPDVLVPVLIEGEGAGSVLDEEVQDADFEVFEFGEFLSDVVRDEVAAARLRREGELFLEPAHCGRCLGLGRGGDCCGGAAGGWAAVAGCEELFPRGEVGSEELEGEEERSEKELESVGEEGEDENYEEEAGVS